MPEVKVGKGFTKSKVEKPSQSDIDKAREFVSSARGQLILGQALAIGARELRDKEPSNASDMAYIGETLFSVFYHIYTDDYQNIMKKATEEANKLNQQTT
tara:strand:+ start:139 stop:438 length:300 start_codon:yes stop_codon:yes gene_type:complete